MKHPAVLALCAGLVVLLAAFALPLLHMGGAPATAPVLANAPADAMLPWRAQAEADGTLRVFGLTLGRDTLGSVKSRLGDALQPALVARLGEVGHLEALMEPFNAGFVSGRLVLSFEVPPATLQRWRERALRSEAMDGGVRRFDMTHDDRVESESARLSGLSFVPGLQLGEADLQQRFGPPAETLPQGDGVRVLLYPAIGMTAAVPATGKTRTALQYVAPREFEARLRAPMAASAPH